MNEQLNRKLGLLVDVARKGIKLVNANSSEKVNKIDKEWLDKLQTQTTSGQKATDILKEAKKQKLIIEAELAKIQALPQGKQDVTKLRQLNEKLNMMYKVIEAYHNAKAEKEEKKNEVLYDIAKVEMAKVIEENMKKSEEKVSAEISALTTKIADKSSTIATLSTSEIATALEEIRTLNSKREELENYLTVSKRILSLDGHSFGPSVENKIFKGLSVNSDSYNILSFYYDMIVDNSINMKAINVEVQNTQTETPENIEIPEHSTIEAMLKKADEENDDDLLEKAIKLIKELPDSDDKKSDYQAEAARIGIRIRNNINNFVQLLNHIFDSINLGYDIDERELEVLKKLYSSLPKDIKEQSRNKVESIIKTNNTDINKEENKELSKQKPKKFGKLTILLETIGLIVDKIRSSKPYKNRLKKKIEKAINNGDEQKAKKYENKLAEQDVVSGPRLMVKRNKFNKFNYKLSTTNELSNRQACKRNDSRLFINHQLFNKLSKKVKDETIFENGTRSKTLLDQQLEMLAYSNAEELDNDFENVTQLIKEAYENGGLSGKESSAYTSQAYNIYNYNKLYNNDVLLDSNNDIDNMIKYYDSDEYKSTKLSYAKRRI